MTGDGREWIASIMWGRASMLGGTLALNDDAVIFRPLGGIGRTLRYALEEIVDVGVAGDRPPRLRLTTTGGRSPVLAVLTARNTPVWTRDTSARDQAVAAIGARLTGR